MPGWVTMHVKTLEAKQKVILVSATTNVFDIIVV